MPYNILYRSGTKGYSADVYIIIHYSTAEDAYSSKKSLQNIQSFVHLTLKHALTNWTLVV